MSELKISIEETFNVEPFILYNAWLSKEGHENMTGGEAEIQAEIGSKFSAWDGYISGEILELETGKRILQTWRTSEFNDVDEDSVVEILLEAIDCGTKLTLNHTKLSSVVEVEKYRIGWEQHYISPMITFFND